VKKTATDEGGSPKVFLAMPIHGEVKKRNISKSVCDEEGENEVHYIHLTQF
jgi:hypothetical protein